VYRQTDRQAGRQAGRQADRRCFCRYVDARSTKVQEGKKARSTVAAAPPRQHGRVWKSAVQTCRVAMDECSIRNRLPTIASRAWEKGHASPFVLGLISRRACRCLYAGFDGRKLSGKTCGARNMIGGRLAGLLTRMRARTRCEDQSLGYIQ
jgi:hypothetical protein